MTLLRRPVSVFFLTGFSFLLLMFALLFGARIMMEDQYHDTRTALLQATLSTELDSMKRLVDSQARITRDMPHFSPEGTDQMIQHHLQSLLQPDRLDGAMLLSANGNPRDIKMQVALPDSLRQHIDELISEAAQANDGQAHSYYLRAQGKVWALVIASLHEASLSQAHGYLVYWRQLDDNYLATLADRYHFSLLKLQLPAANDSELSSSQTVITLDNGRAVVDWNHETPPFRLIYTAIGLGLMLTLALALLGVLLFRNLQRGNQDFRTLFNRNKALQLLVNPLDGSIVMASKTAADFYGHTVATLQRHTLFDITEDNPDILGLLKSSNPFRLRQRTAQGEERLVEIHSGQIMLAGEPLLYLIVHDVTQSHRASRALTRSEARFRAIFEDASLGILQLDSNGRILDANPAFCNMLGYPENNLLRWHWSDLVTGEEREATARTFQAMTDGVVDKLNHQQRFVQASGNVIWTQMNISPVNIQGESTTYVAMVENISERVALQQQLKELAARDPLTGLHNRRSMEEQASREQSWSRRHGQNLCVMIADIDHFKLINDNHGHSVGDIVLREFAIICQQYLRESDILCRWGGEEFVMLLTQTDLSQAAIVAERLRLAVSAMEIKAGRERLQLTISLGLSDWQAEDENFTDALERADGALYAAKRNGRNQVVSSPKEPLEEV
ncbi:diguanylate cyclase [Pokkaliibacter sp. CJK22405]|uniref:diguanylate cyclase n=1 Tax=Pokkaliibacter sp. CJK22405 TaxID=3384615 RepID=UPI0039855955